MSPSKESPIGILDSGVGGLAVARSLLNSMPEEHIIYYGDTARAYFGIKSRLHTLFPFRKNIRQIMSDRVVLVDPTDAIAVMTREHLKKMQEIPKG